jgi:DNA-binding LytR/AlgR family response regulator
MRKRAVRGVVIGSMAAAFLAFLGALGTDQAPLPLRLAYWAAVILPGSLIGIVVQEIVNAWGRLAGNRAAEIAAVALLVSVPHSFMVIVASALFFGLAAITPDVVFGFWIAVLVVSVVLTAINRLAAELDVAPTSVTAATSSLQLAFPPADASIDALQLPALPELIADKIQPHLRSGRLIAIEAEDHYLRIHTEYGSDLVLMRMADACALLPEATGARVHRSWWAARAAAETLSRREGKVELLLANGLRIPVSRAVQASLREQGWASAKIDSAGGGPSSRSASRPPVESCSPSQSPPDQVRRAAGRPRLAD